MKKTANSFLFSILIIMGMKAQTSLRFSSVDSLLQYAEENSATIKTGDKLSLLAKSTKLAALGNTVNPKCPVSASWIDNTKLPVSYVPAEFFGGPAGSLKALSFGQEYVSNYGITPQIDIISPAAWARVKSASINSELTEVTNLLNKKNLFESVAATYYNIVSLQNQQTAVRESIAAADSILGIASRKFGEGIIREQDKNNSEINLLTIRDRLAQINATLEQQYNTLKLLCDIQPSASLQVTENVSGIQTEALPAIKSTALIEKQQLLQAAYLKSELRSNRLLSFAPTVSFVFNQAWQRSSDSGFFDSDANHFSTQYFGLKLTIPFPFDVTRLSQNYTSKINYRISEINAAHAVLQNEAGNKQLDLDHQKALSAYTTGKKIAELKEINYVKSLNQYKEGILSTENLLLAFTDRVNAELNFISAAAALHFSESKIKINNTIQ